MADVCTVLVFTRCTYLCPYFSKALEDDGKHGRLLRCKCDERQMKTTQMPTMPSHHAVHSPHQVLSGIYIASKLGNISHFVDIRSAYGALAREA